MKIKTTKILLSYIIVLSMIMAQIVTVSATRNEISAIEGETLLFSEDFEGYGSDYTTTLQEAYPRGTRDTTNGGLSFWGAGDWEYALDVSDRNGGKAVRTCTASGSNSSRTFEVILPSKSVATEGVMHLSMEIKPQSSLSSQYLSVFKGTSTSYNGTSSTGGKAILSNSDFASYIGKWLKVDVYVDLDNKTYDCTVINLSDSNKVVIDKKSIEYNCGSVGGMDFYLKKSDTTTSWSGIAPIVDNIYIAKKVSETNILFQENFDSYSSYSDFSSRYSRNTHMWTNGGVFYQANSNTGFINTGYNQKKAINPQVGQVSASRYTYAAISNDKKPTSGCVHFSMYLMPKSSGNSNITRLAVAVFQNQSYTTVNAPDGLQIMNYAFMSGYVDKWLHIDGYVNLDEHKYKYYVYNVSNNNEVVKKDDGTCDFSQFSGIDIQYKSTADNSVAWGTHGPLVDDILIEKINPDDFVEPKEVIEEIPAPAVCDEKIIFQEDFEDVTESALQSRYPRGKRPCNAQSSLLSYWGNSDWEGAITTGYNDSSAVYACAGATSSSRTFEAYAPQDACVKVGLANCNFKIKPTKSLSKQELFVFSDLDYNYTSASEGKTGILIFDNNKIKEYLGKWLDVDFWLDLDNGTYSYNVYDTSNGEVLIAASGKHQMPNLAGFGLGIKKSDSTSSWTGYSPIIDDISFKVAKHKPKADVFELKSFIFKDSAGNTLSKLDNTNSVLIDAKYRIGADVNKNASVFFATYNSDGRLLNVSKQNAQIDSVNDAISATVAVDSAPDGCKLFVWDTDLVSPAHFEIDFGKKVYTNAVSDGADIHTANMQKYLSGDKNNIKKYCDASASLDAPAPVEFSWVGNTGYGYILRISEKPDMSDAWKFETEDTYFDVYNLKIGTKYYWCVDAVENNNLVYTSDVKSFTTNDIAPRNIAIFGPANNMRDIGGWFIDENSRVKQGLIYRSSRFDLYENSEELSKLSAGDRDRLCNQLGIKTEIDLRNADVRKADEIMPGKNSSVIGDSVTYYHCPLNFTFPKGSPESVREIFELFADKANYPIVFHCSAGADRTGFIAYTLNGLLGVNRNRLMRDYLLTNFSDQNAQFRNGDDLAYIAAYDSYTGESTKEKIYNYLVNEIGIPSSQLDAIIANLTEEYQSPNYENNIDTQNSIKVLAIGNSFAQDSVSTLKAIAEADGVSIVSTNAYLAGRNLKGHYDAWKTGKEYRIENEGVSTGNYQTLQNFVTMDNWDYIILQGTTHYNEYDAGLWNVDSATTQNYWTTLTNGISELCPNAKRFVHATWAPINELAANVNDAIFKDGTPDARGAYTKALLPNEQIGANIYSTETAQNGNKAYIPTAVAVDYLIRHYGFPEYEKNSDGNYNNSDTARGVYRDTTCHLTANVGRVLAGLVWYEMITGTPATQNKYQRSTLSESDMAKLKEAAHYACKNYMTYDPSSIQNVNDGVDVSATAMKIKNNAKSIITIIHDDGSKSTAEYLNREFAKNNLQGTVGIIGTNVNTTAKVNTWTNILADSNGRLNFASHSYNHRYFGESDNAESGTLSDGTPYSYSAGHLSEDIANERARLNGLFPDERVLTFIKPGVTYPSGKPQVSDAAMNMIREHYIAMRNTGGGKDTIPPADYYSVKSLKAEARDDNAQYWKNNLSSAKENNAMLVYLFHGISDADTTSDLTVKQSDVSVFLKELGKYVANRNSWCAKFDEAMQYCREYSAITSVEAKNYPDENIITVSVEDSISKIDTDIKTGKFAGRDMYDYPITVKTEIPYDWDYVKLTQSYDNRMEIVKTFIENNVRYAYVNVVPDQAAAVLREATESDYVGMISVGGTEISNFDPATFFYKVTLSVGITVAPAVTCNQGSATITQATLSNGEGSAFVKYNDLVYEIHFSVE